MAKKGLAELEPARLTQARRMCGWFMAELASRTGITRQAISSFEKLEGGVKPSPETLRSLAQQLNVDPTFLTAPLRPHELDSALGSAITFRTLSSSSKKDREQAKVYLQWLAGLGGFLGELIEIPSPTIPVFDFGDFSSLTKVQIEQISVDARRAFSLGDGPISNLTLLMENKGVLVGYANLAHKMDG